MGYVELFDNSFSRTMQRDMIRVVRQGCEQSFRYATLTYARPEAYGVLGHIRRAYIEQELRSMAQIHPETIASVEWTKTNSSAHTMITRGQFKLTESKRRSPWQMIRPRVFQKKYSAIFQPDFLAKSHTKKMIIHIFMALSYMGVIEKIY
jgi:hypothetical protein